MKEYPEYRDVLEALIAEFPKGAWIRVSELAQYDGQDVRTIRSRYRIPDGVNGINRNVLARRICELAR